jgi:hypothetical protein
MTTWSGLAWRRRLAIMGATMAMLVFLSGGCATLQRTEDLPSPSDEDSLGGPEGETDPAAP